MKIELTKIELKERVNSEGKELKEYLKSQGVNWPLADCKKEVEKTLRENCKII